VPTSTIIGRFPEVGRPWHHWEITVNADSNNQSAANVIANILFSHRQNLVRLICDLLNFPNSWPKNLGAAYTRANTVCVEKIYIHIAAQISYYRYHITKRRTYFSSYLVHLLAPEAVRTSAGVKQGCPSVVCSYFHDCAISIYLCIYTSLYATHTIFFFILADGLHWFAHGEWVSRFHVMGISRQNNINYTKKWITNYTGLLLEWVYNLVHLKFSHL
jgi:hypothetical protein